jgi:hypothetical protein
MLRVKELMLMEHQKLRKSDCYMILMKEFTMSLELKMAWNEEKHSMLTSPSLPFKPELTKL